MSFENQVRLFFLAGAVLVGLMYFAMRFDGEDK